MNEETKTLEEELMVRKDVADFYFSRVEEMALAIDSFEHKILDIRTDWMFRTRAELLSSLLKVMFELDVVCSVASRYAKLTGTQLLLASNKLFSYNVEDKLESLEADIEMTENIYNSMDAWLHYSKELAIIDRLMLDRSKEIFAAAKEQVEAVRKAIGSVHINYAKMTAEEITRIFDEMLARHESENARLYQNFFDLCVDPTESLRDLRDEREGNEVIKLWHKMPDPYKFVNTLRKQAEKVELDLLPVLDYAIKYKRLQEMRQADAPQRSASRDNYAEHCTFIENQYINPPTNGNK